MAACQYQHLHLVWINTYTCVTLCACTFPLQYKRQVCAKREVASICGSSLSMPLALAISHSGLGTAGLPGHSSTILSQDLGNQYALATFLIMQFILSTCCLHPNFLPWIIIALYSCSNFLCFFNLCAFK